MIKGRLCLEVLVTGIVMKKEVLVVIEIKWSIRTNCDC